MLTDELAQQLPPGARALHDTLAACNLPSQIRFEVENAPVANVKNLLRGLGFLVNPGTKTPVLKASLVDEWLTRIEPPEAPSGDDDVPSGDGDDLPADEPTIPVVVISEEECRANAEANDAAMAKVFEFKTGEQLLAEQRAAKAAAKKVKAEKPIDPQAEARKARYAAAAAVREAKRMARECTDDDVVEWITTQRLMDPGAVCAKEMEVYRWVEDKEIGHQRWNALWHATDLVVEDEPEDDDDEIGIEQALIAMVEAEGA